MRRALAFGVTVLFACGESPSDSPPAGGAVSYHADLRALVEDNCLACHSEGGIAPFRLDSYDALKQAADAVVVAVESGRMPPWLPNPDCRHFEGERGLGTEQQARFRAWRDQGSPEGDPADYVPTLQSGLAESLGPPSLSLKAEAPYAPNPARPDDYRCFPLEHSFTEETFLATSHVVPDQQDLVHHVILYMVAPQFAAAVESLDAQDPGVGYTCFGGVGAGSPQPIAGWVPGSPIQPGSNEAAVRIPPGAKLVLQMHYNVLSAQPAPDQTEVQLWFLDQQPPWLLNPQFFPNLGIQIKAGDASSKQTRRFTNRGAEPWTIVQTGPHMHLLGTSISTHKVRADGTEECLIDIPRWDFNWQQGYTLHPDEYMNVATGESLRLDCTYDNSASNQPFINGERRDPVDVGWGEGTLDEMCLNTLVLLEPYTPLEDSTAICENFQPCYETCPSQTLTQTGCVLQCGAAESGCAECALTQMVSCTNSKCASAADAMLECIQNCADADCVRTECSLLIVGFDACAKPILDSGACDAPLETCNVRL